MDILEQERTEAENLGTCGTARADGTPVRAAQERGTGRTCPGLVVSPKTGRPAPHLRIQDIFLASFPSADLVDYAADELQPFGPAVVLPFGPPTEEQARRGVHYRRRRDSVEVERITWQVTVSPGAVQISTRKAGGDTDRSPWTGPDDDPMACLPIDFPKDTRAETDADTSPGTASNTGRVITGWSPASRSNMTRRLSTLDYTALMATPDTLPGMITLTMPGNWEHLAPTGAAFKAKFAAFRRRWRRAWGADLSCIWKLEFQRRGAPHLHLFTMIPYIGIANGMAFKDWLSTSWADIVGATGEDRVKHLAAGTGIDFAEGLRMRDPRRLVVYFLKHGAPGGAASKEYQNHAPDLWIQARSVGRFWGYTGCLKPAENTVEVMPDTGIELGRVVRRWSHAKGLTRKVLRPRGEHVNPETGEISTNFRCTTVRAQYLSCGRGFVCVNDGTAFASQLAHAAAVMSDATGDPLDSPPGRHPRRFPPMNSPALVKPAVPASSRTALGARP